MKKIFVIILGVIFLIPITVKADMGPPAVREYKATPKSVDGVKYYSDIYQLNKAIGTFEYKTILTIAEERKVNGKSYAYACDKKNNCGYVLISELTLSEKSNLDGFELKYVGRVFAKDGVELYEGPGYIYKKTGDKIPANANVVVSGYDQNETTWLKIKYKDTVGFVDSDDASVMILYKGQALIQKNNKVATEFYKSNAWDRKIAYKEDGKYVIQDEYFEFSGDFKYSKTEFKALDELNLYKLLDYSEHKDSIYTIKKGDTVKFIYDAAYQGTLSYYVEVNGKKGWIEMDYGAGGEYFEGFDYDRILDYIYDNNLYTYNEPVEAKEDEVGDIVPPEEKDKDEKYDWFSKQNIIILSCAGAFLIVLTAIVTMLLVNKKNKKSVQD
ncbi:MAG: hypothetical protein IKX00_02145 [Bacilli bacterium]|nr:hypothetical protein [Bacilli bacterium]